MEQAILKWFESIRCPALTVVASFFSCFGEAIVMAGAVILIYWLVAGRAGEQIAVTALSSFPLNTFLKNVVSRPRPYAAGVVDRLDVDNFLVSTRGLGDLYSFPSGHAQATSSLLTASSIKERRWWMWAASALFVLLVMCSRLYLGVHYPTDLLAGLALGVATAVLWQLVYRYAYGARYYILCGFAILCLVPLLFFADKDYLQAAGFLSGAAFFLPLTSFLPPFEPAPFPKRLLRIPAGALVAGAVFALTLLFPADPGFSLIKWFLIAGAATLGAQSLFRALKL